MIITDLHYLFFWNSPYIEAKLVKFILWLNLLQGIGVRGGSLMLLILLRDAVEITVSCMNNLYRVWFILAYITCL